MKPSLLISYVFSSAKIKGDDYIERRNQAT